MRHSLEIILEPVHRFREWLFVRALARRYRALKKSGASIPVIGTRVLSNRRYG